MVIKFQFSGQRGNLQDLDAELVPQGLKVSSNPPPGSVCSARRRGVALQARLKGVSLTPFDLTQSLQLNKIYQCN